MYSSNARFPTEYRSSCEIDSKIMRDNELSPEKYREFLQKNSIEIQKKLMKEPEMLKTEVIKRN